MAYKAVHTAYMHVATCGGRWGPICHHVASKSLTGRRRAIAVRNCTWLMLNNHIYCTVDPRVDDIPYPYTTIDMHDRDMAPRMLSARGS